MQSITALIFACFVLILNAQDIFLHLSAKIIEEEMPPPARPPRQPQPQKPPQPPSPPAPPQPLVTTTATPPAPAPSPKRPDETKTDVDLRIHEIPMLGQDCQAVGGWPKFTDYKQLSSDKWGRYFEAVYGEVPDSGYPICLSDFWVLYEEEMEKAGVKAPNAASQCPTDASENSTGQLFGSNQGDKLSFPGTIAIFHPPAFGALPDNSWVEVIHTAFPRDEKYGAWFYYAKGSGMWYNIGKSVAFQDHAGGQQYYGLESDNQHDDSLNEPMAQLCAAAGDDTIQFLNHVDPGTCGDCCQQSEFQVSWNIELVACALKGMYACAAEAGDTTLKAGWMGKRNCECVEPEQTQTGDALNCNGVPHR